MERKNDEMSHAGFDDSYRESPETSPRKHESRSSRLLDVLADGERKSTGNRKPANHAMMHYEFNI